MTYPKSLKDMSTEALEELRWELLCLERTISSRKEGIESEIIRRVNTDIGYRSNLSRKNALIVREHAYDHPLYAQGKETCAGAWINHLVDHVLPNPWDENEKSED